MLQVLVAWPLLAVTVAGTLSLSLSMSDRTVKPTSTYGLFSQVATGLPIGSTVTVGFLATVTVVDRRPSPTQSRCPAKATSSRVKVPRVQVLLLPLRQRYTTLEGLPTVTTVSRQEERRGCLIRRHFHSCR